MPPMNGRAGKFLDEERMLREYPLHGPIGFLEVGGVLILLHLDIYNYATSNLAIYSHETSQDKLPEA